MVNFKHLSKIQQKKELFIGEFSEKESKWKTLNKYTAAFSYLGKTLFILPGVNKGVYFAFFLILLAHWLVWFDP